MRFQKLRRMTSKPMTMRNTTASSRLRRREKRRPLRAKPPPNQELRRRAESDGSLPGILSCIRSLRTMVSHLYTGSCVVLDRVMSSPLNHSVKLSTLIHITFQRDATTTRHGSDPPRLPRVDTHSRKSRYHTILGHAIPTPILIY